MLDPGEYFFNKIGLNWANENLVFKIYLLTLFTLTLIVVSFASNEQNITAYQITYT
jgi:hypothetical protein